MIVLGRPRASRDCFPERQLHGYVSLAGSSIAILQEVLAGAGLDALVFVFELGHKRHVVFNVWLYLLKSLLFKVLE